MNQAIKNKELVFVIDGSETGNGCATLMVSLVVQKRSIPIAWITKKGNKGHFLEDMHIELIFNVVNL